LERKVRFSSLEAKFQFPPEGTAMGVTTGVSLGVVVVEDGDREIDELGWGGVIDVAGGVVDVEVEGGAKIVDCEVDELSTDAVVTEGVEERVDRRLREDNIVVEEANEVDERGSNNNVVEPTEGVVTVSDGVVMASEVPGLEVIDDGDSGVDEVEVTSVAVISMTTSVLDAFEEATQSYMALVRTSVCLEILGLPEFALTQRR
jgi:hypothetical protein